MIISNELTPDSFLRGIKNFSLAIDDLNNLTIIYFRQPDKYKIIQENKLEFINFLKRIINQIESSINSGSKFSFDLSQLLKIRQSIDSIDLGNPVFISSTSNRLNSVANFLSLISIHTNSHQINFSDQELQNVKQEIVIIKCEFFY